MSLFDFFGRERTNQTKQKNNEFDNFVGGSKSEPTKSGPITVFHPKSFKDVESVIETLKTGNQAIVHLRELSTDTGMRVLDMLSGATFALGGGIYELENNIFLCSPASINVK